MKKFSADFETSTLKWNENETWVWAWAVCEIGNFENIEIGNNMDSFIEYCKNSKNACFYFHNAKFDFQYIISYLLQNEYTWIKDKKEKQNKTFTTLITDMGEFYSLTIYFEVKNKRVVKAEFRDSLKLLNFSVEKIAKDFGIEEQKLELDYDTPREKNHILTEHEKDYISHDVIIMAKALHIMFLRNLTKLTIASNALEDFKKRIKNFKSYFPNLGEIHKEIKNSFKGGFTYCSPKYKNLEVGSGIVLDVNSLYPSCLRNYSLPIGLPIPFLGKYEEDKLYNLYIQQISCSFKLKKDKIPTIQIKHNRFFIGNEYIEDTHGEIVALTLTNIDLDLFFEQYEVSNLEYIQGWKFKSVKGLFNNYVDYWTKEKIEGSKENNKSKRTIAKLMQNALYGKFATKESGSLKMPFLNEEDIVCYKNLEKEERETIYIPVASFCTAYARNVTIRASQKIRDYSLKKYGKDLYYYSDTDSIHTGLTNENELKRILEVDDFELGKWKIENKFKRAKFLGQKCYIEEIYKNDHETEIKVTCAGMSRQCYNDVTFENFNVGFISSKKLVPKRIKGGVILHETTFEIKAR